MHEVAAVDVGMAIGLGAAGGAIAEAVDRWADLTDWQRARHAARIGHEPVPAITKYIDLVADGLVALTRLAMGALVGWLFHNEVSGVSAAIAVGATAPALLAQVGAARGTR
jgi:hypothetical protein